jgi:hypothetical protein
MVAVSLLAIFGAALLSLDFGSMWSTRRRIITGTDATSLDQAIFIAKTGAAGCNRPGAAWYNPAYASWTEILQKNSGGFEFVGGMNQDCLFYPNPNLPGTGYVGVQARKVGDTRFGGLFGLGNSHPYSFSAARIFYPDAIKGLRPIGICVQNDHYQEWQAYAIDGTMTESQYQALRGTAGHPTTGPNGQPYGTGVIHRITWNKDQPQECGDRTPGNWGWLDFDGGSNSADDLKKWILNGYDGLVNAPGDCNNDGSPDACPGDPGVQGGNDSSCNPNTVAGALACISSTPASVKEFPIVVYDVGACDNGGGNNCSFNPFRYLWVRLWGFQLTGNEADRFFDFEFVRGVATGVCCETNPNQTDVKAVQLCAVDHDNSGLSEAQRCGQGSP